MRIQKKCTLLRAILLVPFFFVSIGIIFAESPTSFELQSDCSGPVNGLWNYSAKEKGTCTCPDSFPLPPFDRGAAVNVCQNGSNITGNMQNITKIKGTASGQQVNFTLTTKFVRINRDLI